MTFEAASTTDFETLYIVCGGVIGVVLTLVFFFVVRGLRNSKPAAMPLPEQLPETPQNLPGLSSVPPDEQREPVLAGLPTPHTTAEIQKPAPKALSSALSNTRSSFFGRIKSLITGGTKLSDDELEGLEEILYTSDLGPQTVQRLLSAVNARMKESGGGSGFESVREAIKEEMLEIFEKAEKAAPPIPVHVGSEPYLEGLERLSIFGVKPPSVLMVVGVNGAGKTTTIGKLSSRLAQSGRKVLVAAGDTFRAAAGNQLKVWTERARVEIFNPDGVSDPSAVAYAACQNGQANGFDVIIIDTAGRLHTQKNLMEELKKMRRVIEKLIPGAPHEVLLVLDANSGQNALIQAREFHLALGVTGVVLTKLDGSAKGGVAVGLAHELGIPIKLIGVGEGIEDLRRFSPQEFVDSII
jgi:fused signal recognition particle receptor